MNLLLAGNYSYYIIIIYVHTISHIFSSHYHITSMESSQSLSLRHHHIIFLFFS